MAEFISGAQNIIALAMAAGFAVSLAFFFWGLVKYIVGGGDEVERLHGKRQVIGSVTWIFLLMVLWWLLSLVDLIPRQFGF